MRLHNVRKTVKQIVFLPCIVEVGPIDVGDVVVILILSSVLYAVVEKGRGMVNPLGIPPITRQNFFI
jgi:hypothetical protein